MNRGATSRRPGRCAACRNMHVGRTRTWSTGSASVSRALMAGAYETALWSFWLVMGSRVALPVTDALTSLAGAGCLGALRFGATR